MPGKKILITGAAGFLGSHLCERFVGEGFRVLGMDNLSTGVMTNIEHLFGTSRFTFKNHDVTKSIHLSGKIDYILHFASPASPTDYLKMPIQTLKVSSLGTHNLLGLAREMNARILIASTSEVYGNPAVTPQPEEYWGHVNPVGPRGVYDEAKRFQEALAMAYHNFHGTDIRIARIFNTYGSKMRFNDGRAIPTFIRQALTGEKLTIFGDGSQTRSFCYVDDTVEAIFRLLHVDYHLPVNIGNPDEVSILELASEIIAISGGSRQIEFLDLPQDDPLRRQPDIRRAKALLGWEPVISRFEGLQRTFWDFQRYYQQTFN